MSTKKIFAMEDFWDQNLPDHSNSQKFSKERRTFENVLDFSRKINFAIDTHNYYQ